MSDEERPLREAREALRRGGEPTAEPESAAGRSPILIYLGIVLAVALIMAALLLPPFSLVERWVAARVEPTPAATPVPTADDLNIPGLFQLTVSANGDNARVVQVSRAAFASPDADQSWQVALAAVPAERSLQSDVFIILNDPPDALVVGQAAVSLPADAPLMGKLDLLGWNGSRWAFLPHTVSADGRTLTSYDWPLPQALVLMSAAPPANPTAAADLLPGQELPADLLTLLTEISLGGLSLSADGQLTGQPAEPPPGDYRALLHITNVDAADEPTSLANLLGDAETQAAHIEELVNRALDGGYVGLNLDYQGATADQRAAFTQFTADLGRALHERGLTFAVTLAAPTRVNESWQSGGQDWAAIGQTADAVYAPMPLAPASYSDGGEAEQVMEWAMQQVDRYKLIMSVSAAAVVVGEDGAQPLTLAEALQPFGGLQLADAAGDQAEIEPGTAVTAAFAGSVTPLEWDPGSLSYWYSYETDGRARQVWLNNESALAYRLRLAQRHYWGGAAVRHLGATENGDNFAAALQTFRGAADAPPPVGAAFSWTVTDADGNVIASDSGADKLSYSWQTPDVPGSFAIRVSLAQGEYVTDLGELNLVTAVAAVEEPEDEDEEDVVEATPEPPPQPVTPATANAFALARVNVRGGPGLEFAIQATIEPDDPVILTGRNANSSWLRARMASGDQGWILASLLNVRAGFNLSELPIVEVEPPGGVGPAPPPVVSASFELGGQTDSLSNPLLMREIGMTWVKFQHRWTPDDDPADLAPRINHAQANGLKVLLTVTGPIFPGGIDYEAYLDFLAGVAALGPSGIEVWTEPNISREWPAGQIDPAVYVNQMLAPAYSRIKAVNSAILVVSGAPAPTGIHQGCGPNGCDDARFIEGMAAAGAANYMDCIGVRYTEGAVSPTQSAGDARDDFYTRYFSGMNNLYWNAFGGARPLCYTELGYLSGDGFSPLPELYSWAGNTAVNQQSQWLAEAVSLAGNGGRVRLLIIFNVDLPYYANNDVRAGYAMIRPDGGCPACGLIRQVMGR